MPPLGDHDAKPADHDPQAAEIREAAQCVGEDQARPRRKTVRRKRCQVQIRNEFVQHGLGGHQRRGHAGFMPRQADEPHHRLERQREDALQGDGAVTPMRQQAQRGVDQCYEGHRHQQCRDNSDEHGNAIHGAFDNGIQRTARRIGDDQALLGGIARTERHQQCGNGQCGGRADDRGDQDVAQCIRYHRREERCVDHHDSARDACHAAGHQCEQLAALHACEIRTHEQRCLDHADEHMHSGTESERATNAHRASQEPCECTGHALQHAPMEQQRCQRTDRQHQRECLKREDEAGAGMQFSEWQRGAAEIAEQEVCADLRGIL